VGRVNEFREEIVVSIALELVVLLLLVEVMVMVVMTFHGPKDLYQARLN
jgi:hypothetical protein